MKQSIAIDDVKVGMYVHSLGKNWLKHDFVLSHFLIDDNETLKKLKNSKLKTVVIDTEKSLDIGNLPSAKASKSEEKADNQKITSTSKNSEPLFPVTTGADIQLAKKACLMAAETVRSLMNDSRAGKALKLESAETAAESILKSIDRNPHALNAITRLKSRDDYTLQHSVSVSALLAGFARGRYGQEEVEEITIGGLVHDIGKINVPDQILNKPDRLTDNEFVIMKQHVLHSRELLNEANFTEKQIDIALMHHERPDGKGYPFGLGDGEISEIGYSAAVIDVYDALSSKRVYKKAWEPSQALKHMVKWGSDQFNMPTLVSFINYVGVYPVGTWVALSNNCVGFVIAQSEDKLNPVVRLKLSLRDRRTLDHDIDLSSSDEVISAVVSAKTFGLDDDFDV